MNKILRSMRLPEFTAKLTVRLFLLLAVCAVLCCSSFRVLMLRQTEVYEWLVKKRICGLDTERIIKEVSERAKNITFTGAKDEELMEALGLEKYQDGYTAIYIYQGEEEMFQFGITPQVWDTYLVQPFWYSDLGYYTGQNTIEKFEFKDTTATLAIYSYHQTKIALPYMAVSFGVSLLFFLPVVLYMQNRMKYVGKLKNQILIMANGDLESRVTIKGQDEIGIMAGELDKMRGALNENIKREEKVRKSNHELIRSVSHDLRTPMTTMYGYLEILERKKCTEKEQQEYISRCIQKIEEIRCLSDKIFEYAFVYDAQEQEEQNVMYVEELLEELEKNGQFLERKGYDVAYKMEGQGRILGSRSCFQRIWNNLFSNVMKYGTAPVLIEAGVDKGNIRIKIVNKIKKEIEEVESNKIGLNSVEKMTKLQGGEVFVTEDEENFAVTLWFPLIS